ncbi:unnamed protein product [Clonostachys byssicola]|uniref:Zn(2)-C6 fungal-type domain-containing protein n=1 Tax=Clonostachys byssicola TaxID=160290 RepID=A0A9N9UEU3_9HYPO|nr:unnamed protein product [Clonostachys byssicola]
MPQAHRQVAIAPRPAGITPIAPLQPKKRRASKPKVRTGCVSCKIRRVKCDEQKPTCERCSKDGFSCDGYGGHPHGTSTVKATMPRWPRPHWRNPHPSRLIRQDDAQYFDFFRGQLVYELSGYSHSEFWLRIVPCESTLDKCALESVLAIGALSTAIRLAPHLSAQSTRRPSALHPWSAIVMANVHHEAAVRHYIKALALFRSRLEAEMNKASPRSLLIVSLLLITFELLQGDMKSADSLITRSINLLKHTLKLHRQEGLAQQVQTPRSSEDDLEDMEHLLPLISIMGGYTPFLLSQSSNIQLWDTTCGRVLPNCGQPSISKLDIQWNKFHARAVAFIGVTMKFQTLPLPQQRDTEEQRNLILAQLRVWQIELDSWCGERTCDEPSRVRTLQIMQIQRQTLLICISCCLDATDMMYDDFEAEFDILLARCVEYLRESRPTYLFTLSTSILSALLVVVNRCRVHNIRMTAAGIIRQIQWREGAWEPALMLNGKLAGVLMEERSRDKDGLISSDCRWFWAATEWEAERKQLVATYVRAVPDDYGQPVNKTLVLDPDKVLDVCSAIGCRVDHNIEHLDLLLGKR